MNTMKMDEQLLTAHRWCAVSARDAEVRKAARKVPLYMLFTGVMCLALFTAGAVDYVFLREVFEYLLSGEPNEAGYWSPNIMALSGLVAIFSFHALTFRRNTERFEGGISLLAAFSLAALMIGVGLILAAIVYVTGASSLTDTSLHDSVEVFVGEAVEESRSSFVQAFFKDHVLPVFPVIFAIGLGGVFVLSVYTAHRLLTGIHWLVVRIFEDRTAAKVSAERLARLRELDTAHHSLVQEFNKRTVLREEGHHLRHAEAIVATGLQGMRAGERLLSERKLNPSPTDQDKLIWQSEGLPEVLCNLDLGELERRVEALRETFTIENVLTIIHKHAHENGGSSQ